MVEGRLQPLGLLETFSSAVCSIRIMLYLRRVLGDARRCSLPLARAFYSVRNVTVVDRKETVLQVLDKVGVPLISVSNSSTPSRTSIMPSIRKSPTLI